MREVTVYYAYDETEFYTYGECFEYEEKARKNLEEINAKYSFFDKDMNLLRAPLESTDVEEWIDWLMLNEQKIDYVYRNENLSKEANNFILSEFGYVFQNEDFNNEFGLFRFNYRECNWIKVE